MRKKLLVVLSLMFILVFSACAKTTTTSTNGKEESIKIEDDLGKTIELKEPAKKIISLYSAHTENLFSLQLDKEIIGVSKSDKYPKEVSKKKVYDYKEDPENIIKAQPDVVLLRTTTAKAHKDFVKSLENAGIKVISLYPKKLEDFDKYIKTLGKITGKEKVAEEKLNRYHKNLNAIKTKSSQIKDKRKVYFESTTNDLRTVTKDSFAGKAIEYAGGINVAKDATSLKKSSIASYGTEKILSKASEIEVYVAQKGVMNRTVSVDKIKKRAGFDKINAIKNDRVYIINEKLISSPTFRYVEGVKQLQKFMYDKPTK